MTTTTKKVAKQLAAAILALDLADWHARDWRAMQHKIRPARERLSRLFTATGYEFGESSPLRIVQRRTYPATGAKRLT